MYGVFRDVDEDGIVVDTWVVMVEKAVMMRAEKVQLGSLGMNTEGSLLNFELQIILLAPNILHHSNIPFSRNIFSLFFSP